MKASQTELIEKELLKNNCFSTGEINISIGFLRKHESITTEEIKDVFNSRRAFYGVG